MPTPEAFGASQRSSRAAVSDVVRRPRRARGEVWLYAYLVTELLCSVLLLVKELAPARVVIRSMAIGTSLLFLFVIPRRAKVPVRHPATPWALAAIIIVTLSALNPDGGAPLAVVMHWLLYLAVLAPLFWVARLELDERALGRVLMVVWAYQSISSVVGVLQVYYPGTFLSAQTLLLSEQRNLTIRLASGAWVPRPSGLSDSPGGAGPGGFYATLFGLGVVLTKPFRGATVAGLISMMAGMMCMYLAQVRVVIVMLGICFLALVLLLVLAGRISRLVAGLVLTVVVTLASFELAYAVGGRAVSDRLSSLVQAAPVTVYNRNRGMMLEDDFVTRLPAYPVGAGLGHWGMMNAYFGSREHEIGAELQWGGWILDGGIALVLVSTCGLLSAIFVAVRASVGPGMPERRNWAAVVAAHNVGTLAMCFSYAPFIGTMGLDFWLVNAVLVHAIPRAIAVRRDAPRVADRRGYVVEATTLPPRSA